MRSIRLRSETGSAATEDVVSISDDLLLQMFVEKKIERAQLRAGRMWQRHMNDALVQPCTSIDPGASLASCCWQGSDLQESQYRSMNVRRLARTSLGLNGIRFLDIVLAPEIGRPEVIAACGLRGPKMERHLEWLLSALAVYFGLRTSGGGDVYGDFADAADERLTRDQCSEDHP